jgi:uncharacterized protein YkwD
MLPPLFSLVASVALSLLCSAQDTVVTITALPSAPSQAPQFVSSDLFTSAILNSTNFFRAEHNATAVIYNETLEAFAADYLDGDTDCTFAHSGGPYGENIALGCSDAQSCVDAWGDERIDYDYGNPGFSEETGHFTQLVWKATTAVGCGRRLCGTSGWFLVCEYFPRGNVIGQFANEVGGQINGTTSAADGLDAPVWQLVLVWLGYYALCVGLEHARG